MNDLLKKLEIQKQVADKEFEIMNDLLKKLEIEKQVADKEFEIMKQRTNVIGFVGLSCFFLISFIAIAIIVFAMIIL